MTIEYKGPNVTKLKIEYMVLSMSGLGNITVSARYPTMTDAVKWLQHLNEKHPENVYFILETTRLLDSKY